MYSLILFWFYNSVCSGLRSAFNCSRSQVTIRINPRLIGRVWERWQRMRDREQWEASYNNNNIIT